MAVDLDQRIHHPLVLLTGLVGTVLQHQPGLGHPDGVGHGECKDAWTRREQKKIVIDNMWKSGQLSQLHSSATLLDTHAC